VRPLAHPLLLWRLAVGDLKRRRVQSLLLVATIAAATTTLTLTLTLRQVSKDPFAQTRAATRGPDLVAQIGLGVKGAPLSPGVFAPLRHARGVRKTAGPYPIAFTELRARGGRVSVEAEGRATRSAALDQPRLTVGAWLRPGGAVVEQGLAESLRLKVGDTIHLAGRPFQVTGIALSTAQPFYPAQIPGVVWVQRGAAGKLATRSRPLGYMLDIELAEHSATSAFQASRSVNTFAESSVRENIPSLLESWQQIRSQDYKLVRINQKVLLVGSWLLAILAVAVTAVAMGGRIAEQSRRIGLLKAVGATPRLVTAALSFQALLVALLAACIGLAAGDLLAPSLASPGRGLLASTASPHPTPGEAALVIAAALAVAAAATIPAAVRGARASTVGALTEPVHPPGRRARLIEISAALPAPLLLGMRLLARRTRRSVLSAAGLAVAVAMAVAALTVQHELQAAGQAPQPGMLTSTIGQQANHVLIFVSVTLAILAATSVIFTTWATVIDAQHTTALARAFGATPGQISRSLATAQLIPALVAACIGIPGGLLLYQLSGGHLAEARPPLLWLLAVIPATLVTVSAVTAIPAHIGARRPVAPTLRDN
jgi:putative ABC transport system permease protein